MDEPTISKTLWTDSPEFVALQQRVARLEVMKLATDGAIKGVLDQISADIGALRRAVDDLDDRLEDLE